MGLSRLAGQCRKCRDCKTYYVDFVILITERRKNNDYYWNKSGNSSL